MASSLSPPYPEPRYEEAPTSEPPAGVASAPAPDFSTSQVSEHAPPPAANPEKARGPKPAAATEAEDEQELPPLHEILLNSGLEGASAARPLDFALGIIMAVLIMALAYSNLQLFQEYASSVAMACLVSTALWPLRQFFLLRVFGVQPQLTAVQEVIRKRRTEGPRRSISSATKRSFLVLLGALAMMAVRNTDAFSGVVVFALLITALFFVLAGSLLLLHKLGALTPELAAAILTVAIFASAIIITAITFIVGASIDVATGAKSTALQVADLVKDNPAMHDRWSTVQSQALNFVLTKEDLILERGHQFELAVGMDLHIQDRVGMLISTLKDIARDMNETETPKELEGERLELESKLDVSTNASKSDLVKEACSEPDEAGSCSATGVTVKGSAVMSEMPLADELKKLLQNITGGATTTVLKIRHNWKNRTALFEILDEAGIPTSRETVMDSYKKVQDNIKDPELIKERVTGYAVALMSAMSSAIGMLSYIFSVISSFFEFLGPLVLLLSLPRSPPYYILAPMPLGTRNMQDAIESDIILAINAFFKTTTNTFLFQAFFIYVHFSSFGLNLEFLAALLSGFGAALPFLPEPFVWVGLIGLPQLALQRRWIECVVLVILPLFVDTSQEQLLDDFRSEMVVGGSLIEPNAWAFTLVVGSSLYGMKGALFALAGLVIFAFVYVVCVFITEKRQAAAEKMIRERDD